MEVLACYGTMRRSISSDDKSQLRMTQRGIRYKGRRNEPPEEKRALPEKINFQVSSLDRNIKTLGMN